MPQVKVVPSRAGVLSQLPAITLEFRIGVAAAGAGVSSNSPEFLKGAEDARFQEENDSVAVNVVVFLRLDLYPAWIRQ